MIDINPALEGRERLETFLHECAHVRLGHVDNLRPLTWQEENEGIPAPARARLAAIGSQDPEEMGADILRDMWLNWAEKRITDIPAGYPWEVKEAAILAALDFWTLGG